MMTLVGGGLVSFWGPVIGVFLFLTARDVIGALTNAWMLYFGLLFIAIVLFRRGHCGRALGRRAATFTQRAAATRYVRDASLVGGGR
ncbi:hypothetical protein ACQ5SK_01070 [Bradyrhizobium japonicum]